jgi:diguanylate cyclase (GGDEF)-like protein
MMRTALQATITSFWSRPDPVLSDAGVRGEMFIAKIRLLLATVLLAIPLINIFVLHLWDREGAIGLSLTSGIFVLSLAAYLVTSRGYSPSWMSFASSSFDVSLVGSALVVFLLLNEPLAAINSRIIFEGYFLAIAGTSLRYDQRVCITAGLLALAQYFSVTIFAFIRWDLTSPIFDGNPYGGFGWSIPISRLIMMFCAIVLSVSVVRRSQKLLSLATTDHLTGLYNRGYVDDRAVIELSHAQRHGHALSVAFIDVDHFKTLNDSQGHAFGDFVLRSLGEVLRESFRQSDTVSRYGGEEFVVVMPETNAVAAQAKLESLRALIAATPIESQAGRHSARVTVSIGLASFPQDGDNAVDLFAAADERLFQAKRNGRNRVAGASSLAVA